MDRLPALIILAVSLGSCGKADAPALPSRGEGAKVVAGQKPTTDAFCDFHKTDDSGPLLQIPPVGEVKVISKPGVWTWVNLWATWCKPCIEEMPRISKWRDKLLLNGKEVNLQLVSLDDNDADVAAFAKLHPEMGPTARLADGKSQGEWFKQLGLDASPTIPIHVFVSPTGHVRCARAGSVREQDYAAIELLLRE